MHMKLPMSVLLCILSATTHAQATPATAEVSIMPAAAGVEPPTGAKLADASKETIARAAIKALNPGIEVDSIGPAPLPGFQEAIVNGQVLYLSDNGRYLLQGSLFDLTAKKDLSQNGLSKMRREALAKIPATDRIVFAPTGTPKYTVAVFTDIECGFCRKLHSEIAEYNKLGISVEYLAFPRAGLNSPDALAMASVWCSDDRRKALTDAKNGVKVPPKQCTNPVATEYALGQRLGLQGTPMIINSEGVAMPGYLPPAQMLEALDRLAAEDKGKMASNP
jgi:thiol:disulfide interchange protein DsbC